MKDHPLVTITGREAFTTSFAIAEGVELEHRAVLQLIRKYQDEINDGAFVMRRRGKKQSRTDGEYFELDEEQALFLITLMKNSAVVVKFKRRLVKEFIRQRRTIAALIAQQQDAGWQNVRKDGKQIYFQKTDVIKKFVAYATAQGSKSAQMYYANFAKMENSALFFFEQKYPNMREVMSVRQLMQVATADDVVEKALKDGMAKALPYKDIYLLAKERVTAFSEIIGKSPITHMVKSLGITGAA